MSFVQKRTSTGVGGIGMEEAPGAPMALPGLPGGEGPGQKLDDKQKAMAAAGIVVAGVALYLLNKYQAPPEVVASTSKVVAAIPGKVTVTATISPQSLVPGSQTILNATVKGAAKGDTLQVTSNTGQPDINADLNGDASQALKLQYNVPAGTSPGQYTIQVFVLRGNVLLANTQMALSLVSPIQGTSPTPPGQGGSLPAPSGLTPAFTMAGWGDKVHLAWVSPPGTRWIRLEVKAGVSEVAGQAPPSLTQVLSSVNSVDVPTPKLGGGNYLLLPGVQYNWNVSASASASKPTEDDLGSFGPPVRSSFTTPQPTSTLSVIEPTGTTQEALPLFRWSDNNPHQFMYQVEVSTSPTFSNASLYMVNLHADAPDRPGPISSFRPDPKYLEGGVMPPGTIYWRVRPLGSKAWSATWQFFEGGTLSLDPPGKKVTLPAPVAPVAPPIPPVAPVSITLPAWNASSSRTGSGFIANITSPSTGVVEIWGMGVKGGNQDAGTARLFNIVGPGFTGDAGHIEDAFSGDLIAKGYQVGIVLVVKDRPGASGSTVATGLQNAPGFSRDLSQVMNTGSGSSSSLRTLRAIENGRRSTRFV